MDQGSGPKGREAATNAPTSNELSDQQRPFQTHSAPIFVQNDLSRPAVDGASSTIHTCFILLRSFFIACPFVCGLPQARDGSRA